MILTNESMLGNSWLRVTFSRSWNEFTFILVTLPLSFLLMECGKLGLTMTSFMYYIVILKRAMEKRDFQQWIIWFQLQIGHFLEAKKGVSTLLRKDFIEKVKLIEMMDNKLFLYFFCLYISSPNLFSY